MRKTLHFGPDFNLVMDKELTGTVLDAVPSTFSKPPNVMKVAFLQAIGFHENYRFW